MPEKTPEKATEKTAEKATARKSTAKATASTASNEVVPTDDPATSSPLTTQHGTTTIADSVVAKIAGIATREVDGVHDLGGTAARAVGAVRERISSGSQNLTQGVSVEVGERQAAVDIDLVAEYGVALADLAGAIRSNVIDAVQQMTGLEVTEVNVTVHDVWIDGDADGDEDKVRVQ